MESSNGFVVYTVIIDRFDVLKPPQVVNPNIEYFCFSDEPLPKVQPWKQVATAPSFSTPRCLARNYKILAHRHIEFLRPNIGYSLYHDGRIQLKIDPMEAFRWLNEHDMAVCEHPTDDCLYDEGRKVWGWRLDDREVVNRQMLRYRAEGYPNRNGLAATAVILRRHTDAIQRFNNYWWIEVGNHSVRDQLSFNYVCWLLDMGYDVIPGNVFRNPNFVYAESHSGGRR